MANVRRMTLQQESISSCSVVGARRLTWVCGTHRGLVNKVIDSNHSSQKSSYTFRD